MSAPICKVADIIFVRFELVDLEPQKEYMEHFGMLLAHETQDTIFYRGTGTSPYCYVATKGETNRFIGTAYRANAYADLEALAAAKGVDIVENSEPGGGHKVTLIDPDNIEIEVYHGMQLVEPISIDSTMLNTGVDKPRENTLQRFGRGADEWQLKDDRWVYELTSKVKRLGHTAINVADAAASVDWYAKNLGFLISDNLIAPDESGSIGAFMRCNQGDKPVDHHTLNNVQIMGAPKAAFGHAGYEVTDSIDDLMAGHYHMRTVDKYYHEWGIGRHLLGSQMYDYWRDPSGFTHEHWTDGDLLDASIEATDTAARDLIMAQYGPEAPASFGASMPSDEVDDFRAVTPKLSDIVKMIEQQAK
jgi:catechol 2,3-dioxygenase-like lactoylglutathione lyase family enzyme